MLSMEDFFLRRYLCLEDLVSDLAEAVAGVIRTAAVEEVIRMAVEVVTRLAA